jgi:pimeloyl-ACP methyl ester carboxylesterase
VLNYFYDADQVRYELYETNGGKKTNWLFFPGGPGADSCYLRSLVDELDLPGNVWLIDLPGNGSNEDPSYSDNFDRWFELFPGIVKQFENPIVVGHSFGGRVAVCLAALYPDRVGPLVLTGVPLLRVTPSRPPSARYRILRAFNRSKILSDARFEEVRRQTGSSDYRAASGVMRDVLVRVVNESYEPQLRALTAPVSLIWGAGDREVPVSIAHAAAEVIQSEGREVDLEVLERVGHFLPLEAPEALRNVIDRALAK